MKYMLITPYGAVAHRRWPGSRFVTICGRDVMGGHEWLREYDGRRICTRCDRRLRMQVEWDFADILRVIS